MSERLLVDTNVLLRFLTGEPADLAKKARTLVQRADSGEVTLILLPLVVCETFFTLESFYKMTRGIVATHLTSLLECRGIETVERERVLDALSRCQQSGVHLVDAFLASYAAELKMPVASFDRDFEKFKDVQRYFLK